MKLVRVDVYRLTGAEGDRREPERGRAVSDIRQGPPDEAPCRTGGVLDFNELVGFRCRDDTIKEDARYLDA